MEETVVKDKKICSVCGTDDTYIDKGGHRHWYNHVAVLCCSRCELSVFKNPKRVGFKGKTVLLKKNPRKGVCSTCGKKGKTHMHHIQYHEDDPLKDTVELCPDCHSQQHQKSNIQRTTYKGVMRCIKCKSEKIIKAGHKDGSGGYRQRWFCKECFSYFVI